MRQPSPRSSSLPHPYPLSTWWTLQHYLVRTYRSAVDYSKVDELRGGVAASKSRQQKITSSYRRWSSNECSCMWWNSRRSEVVFWFRQTSVKSQRKVNSIDRKNKAPPIVDIAVQDDLLYAMNCPMSIKLSMLQTSRYKRQNRRWFKIKPMTWWSQAKSPTNQIKQRSPSPWRWS